MPALAKDQSDPFGEFPKRYNAWEKLAKLNYDNRYDIYGTPDPNEVKLWQAACDEWPRHKGVVDKTYAL